MPNLIGVRVHFNDTRLPVLHEAGRKWYAEEDGHLRITNEHVHDVAVHAPMEWAWAELVHAEPEPEPEPEPAPPTVGTIGNPITVTWNPYPNAKPDPIVAARMRLTAAHQELEDAVLAFAQARGAA